MTIQGIYQLAINKGIEAEFRGREGVEKLLLRKKDKFAKLSQESKAEFDEDTLINPYSDSRTLHVAEDKEIKRVLKDDGLFYFERRNQWLLYSQIAIPGAIF